MIKLQVIGNLGKDCVTNTVNGKNVINFNVAHTEKFKDAQGNQKDKTIWVDCAYWTDRTGIALVVCTTRKTGIRTTAMTSVEKCIARNYETIDVQYETSQLIRT